MLLLLALLPLVTPSLGQQVFSGVCPSPTILEPFNDTAVADLTAHTWYEARRYAHWNEDGKRCITWQFSGSSPVFTATTTMTGLGTSTMVARITLKDQSSEKADFNYVFVNSFVLGTYNYQILALEKEKFLLAWSCRNLLFGLKHEEIFWLLTKEKVPTTDVINEALLAASTAGLTVDQNKLRIVQQNC